LQLPSKILEDAVEKLSIFPGIGKRTALRMVIYLLQQPNENVFAIGKALDRLKRELSICARCHNIAEAELCNICKSKLRDSSKLCVVENFTDILAIESTAQYKGYYHVLGGLISPMDGITPETLNIGSLLKRMEEEPVEEIIFALSATMEGDTTAFYLTKKLKNMVTNFTQISRGVSVGAELEFTDEATLARSIVNRVPYSL